MDDENVQPTRIGDFEIIKPVKPDTAATKLKKSNMIKAMIKCLGVVTTAALTVPIGRQSHYDWMEKDPDYAAAINQIPDMVIDFVESKMFQLIDGVKVEKKDKKGNVYSAYEIPPDFRAIQFYLKTRAKDRGYSETMQIEVGEGLSPMITFTKTEK